MIIIFAIPGLLLLLAILWVNGIDHMKEKHPDYKGEDFLE